MRGAAAVGVRLDELDAVAREVIFGAGATSPFLGYRPRFADSPFPASSAPPSTTPSCTGSPGATPCARATCSASTAGRSSTAGPATPPTTFSVGTPRPGDADLVAATKEALAAGIAAAVPGNRIGDVSAAIGAVGRAHGCGVNTTFGGHGVGRTMHEDPSVPNDGRAGRGLVLRPGLVIAIEPWFLAGGSPEFRTDADGWTLRSADGSSGAHEEHTVAVTADGPVVLTAP